MCECRGIGTVRHYLAFCRLRSSQRQQLAIDTGTTDAKEWLNEYPRQIAIWMLENLPLAQYSWTKENMIEMVKWDGRKEERGREGKRRDDPG